MASLSQTSWLSAVLSRLTAVSGIGYVATAYTVSRWLTRGARTVLEAAPLGAELIVEDVECITVDDCKLRGWVVEPATPLATVALFHGIRCNRMDMLDRIVDLTAAGYRCVAFDHRAHGESEGKQSSFGFHEQHDVTAVLDLIKERWSDQPRAAIGVSMGAAAICYAAERAREFNTIVLESMYSDLARAFTTRVGSDYPAWFQRFRRGVIWITERRINVRLPLLAPIEHVGELAPAAVLVLTGTEDVHASPQEAIELYKRCRGRRELAFISGAGHCDVYEVGGVTYRQTVLDFLRRHIFAAGEAPRPGIERFAG